MKKKGILVMTAELWWYPWQRPVVQPRKEIL